MVVRPRLVEEGVPIGFSSVNGGETMEIEPISTSTAATSNVRPPNNRTTSPVPATSSSNKPKSSLHRAVGGKIRPPRRSTRTVIGGETLNDAELAQCEHHGASYHPPPSSYYFAAESHHQPSGFQYQQHGHHANPTNPPNSAYHQYLATQQHEAAPLPPPATQTYPHHHHPTQLTTESTTATHIEIGCNFPTPERMEGVEDQGEKTPLVVFDGANIAYAYAEAAGDRQRGPDVRGLLIALRYWERFVRVSIVVPQPWIRQGKDGNLWRDHHEEVYETLRPLMVTTPSGDDDDAYALTIARILNSRAVERSRRMNVPLQDPAYVVSNDMFRDAQQRDRSNKLEEWLNEGMLGLGPGRISYTFGNLYRMNQYGENELDFLPNSRHPLVIWWTEQQRVL